jgi:hypothetical protein
VKILKKRNTLVSRFLNVLFVFEHWLIVTLKYFLKIYLDRKSGQAVKTKAHK